MSIDISITSLKTNLKSTSETYYHNNTNISKTFVTEIKVCKRNSFGEKLPKALPMTTTILHLIPGDVLQLLRPKQKNPWNF